MLVDQPITQCSVCGGALWDNRGRKKNPKGPDWTCKNEDCKDDNGYKQGFWLKRHGNGQAGNARPGGGSAAAAPKWSWGSLSKTYHRCLEIATREVRAAAEVYKVGFTTADVLQATATLFIAASRDGMKADPPQQQPLEERPQQLDDDDGDDLPF